MLTRSQAAAAAAARSGESAADSATTTACRTATTSAGVTAPDTRSRTSAATTPACNTTPPTTVSATAAAVAATSASIAAPDVRSRTSATSTPRRSNSATAASATEVALSGRGAATTERSADSTPTTSRLDMVRYNRLRAEIEEEEEEARLNEEHTRLQIEQKRAALLRKKRLRLAEEELQDSLNSRGGSLCSERMQTSRSRHAARPDLPGGPSLLDQGFDHPHRNFDQILPPHLVHDPNVVMSNSLQEPLPHIPPLKLTEAGLTINNVQKIPSRVSDWVDDQRRMEGDRLTQFNDPYAHAHQTDPYVQNGNNNPENLARWIEYAARHDDGRSPRLHLLASFLELEADGAMKYGIQPQLCDVTKSRDTIHATVTQPENINSCNFCGGAHKSVSCAKLLSLSVDDRWLRITGDKRCFICLKIGHNWRSCKAIRCGQGDCRKPHHKLLHYTGQPTNRVTICEVNEGNLTASNSSRNQDSSSLTVTPSNRHKCPVDDEQNYTFTLNSKTDQVYLKIVPVTIFGPKGSLETFALLDDGSTATIITSKATQIIGLEGQINKISIKGITGTKHNVISQDVKFDIKGRYNPDNDIYSIYGRTFDRLSFTPQSISKEIISKYEHLQDLVGVLTYENAVPEVLIGVNNYHLLITYEYRVGSVPSQPAAALTNLGWVCYGGSTLSQRSLLACNCTVIDSEPKLRDLEVLIKKHYELDSLGISEHTPYTESEKQALEILEKTTRRLPDGRFEVGLLWRGHTNIPHSYEHALSRFKSLERKCAKSEEYAKLYQTNIDAYVQKGYAESCTDPYRSDSTQPPRWYLPHFGVTHPQKPGKLRIVHDAAAKSRGVSLNDLLLPGPDLLNSLINILFRFREGEIALNGDIREMFSQIKIRVEDRDFQRYLWRDNNSSAEVSEFRMSSVIFGATSSPCTALYVKNKNARDYERDYPEAAKAIIHDHYMDDFLGSTDNVDHAAQLAADVTFVHSQGGFEMRSWTSNRPEALHLIPKELHRETKPIELGSVPGLRILGIHWVPETDIFKFQRHVTADRQLNRRKVLSDIMKLFDPLGFINPIVIYGKILLQKTWISTQSWDEPLPEVDCIQWRGWYAALNEIHRMEVPRHYFPSGVVTLELHVFADAGEHAYAAVAYWRVTFSDNRTLLSLIASKARVAPVKPISIPRLELQGAVVAARLADTICKAHRYAPTRRVFWSDSKTALSWIRSDVRNFRPFVAHRVGEITELTRRDEWRWVSSQSNVADEATKPILRKVDELDRWINGPPFLLCDERDWPSDDFPVIPLDFHPEELKVNELNDNSPGSTLTGAAAPSEDQCANPIHVTPNPKRFSHWLKLLRSTAIVLKFVRKLLAKIRNFPCVGTELTAREDLQLAEKIIWKTAQRECFAKEIDALKAASPLPRASKLKLLNPSLDSDGLLRMSGRIQRVSDVKIEKRPLILPGAHPAVRLLIQHFHRQFAHGFNETVINEIRQQYWIPGLRSVVRSIAHNCQFCKVRRAIPTLPIEGNLPIERLAHHARPFTHSGLDYFGPLPITVGRRREKRWVAIFTCLTTRAVHLEVIQDLSGDAAIMGLRRLIARRGCPSTIISDNSTAFVGAANELKRLEANAEQRGIVWKFIPPASPSMGGVWERLVRTVKRALNVVLKERAPKEPTLTTLLAEVEAIVNSRPITYISADQLEALTPFHFLIGTSSPALRPTTTDESDLFGRKEWRKAQALAEAFWIRWIREYLPELRRHHYAATMTNNSIISEGDLVFVADPGLPRGTWPMGRIIKLLKGSDGVARVAEIRTKGGVFRRAVRFLAKIDVTDQ